MAMGQRMKTNGCASSEAAAPALLAYMNEVSLKKPITLLNLLTILVLTQHNNLNIQLS